jgi:tetratricopeptide (TPR) repeat protein
MGLSARSRFATIANCRPAASGAGGAILDDNNAPWAPLRAARRAHREGSSGRPRQAAHRGRDESMSTRAPGIPLLACVTWAAYSLSNSYAWQAPTPAPCPSPAPASEQLYQAGCRALEACELDRAVELLGAALVRRPDEPQYAIKLSQAYERIGRCDDARRVLENTLWRQPGQLPVRTALARHYVEGSRPERAIRLLGEVEQEIGPDGVCLLVEAYRRAGQAERGAACAERALARDDSQESIWVAYVDLARSAGQPSAALERVAQAERRLGCRPRLHLSAALAYEQLGLILGATEVRTVPGGRRGQFDGEWLLLEARERADAFLCCPPASAMNRVRRVLDAGLEDTAAILLHARLWERIGQPAIGFGILRAHEERIAAAGEEGLDALCDLALSAGELPDFLKYNRLRAKRDPRRSSEVLAQGYVELAERYGRRGDMDLHAEFLARALELRPDDAGLRLRLADAEWDRGRRSQAGLLYRRVLQQNGQHTDRARLLRRLEELGEPAP